VDHRYHSQKFPHDGFGVAVTGLDHLEQLEGETGWRVVAGVAEEGQQDLVETLLGILQQSALLIFGKMLSNEVLELGVLDGLLSLQSHRLLRE
jgi:hypothetical protein